MSASGPRTYSVFVGDVSLDEYFRTDVWPGSGAKVDMTPIGSHVGGMIANAAAVYAGYGGSVRFLWAMNDGEMSRLLLADLESLGIDTSLVIRDCRTRRLAQHHRAGRGRAHRADARAGPDTIALTDCGARRPARRPSRLHRDRRPALAAARRPARQRRSSPTSAAPGRSSSSTSTWATCGRGTQALISSADVLLVNRLGFERLRGGRTESETVAHLLDGAARVVVVTLGPEGCRVASRSGAFTVPGIAVDPVDVTGAGDTFGASFVHALDVTDDLVAAATFANAAAARAVCSPGGRSGVATEEEVVAFADRHGVPVALHLQPTQDAGRAPRRHGVQVDTIERSTS